MDTVTPSDDVHVVIGGYHYYLDTDDLLRHPNSYFAHMLKDEWVKDKTAVITLDRNGKLFRYISYYLFTGQIDPNRKPILSLDMLIALRTEADFYGLPELVSLCDTRIKNNIDQIISKQRDLSLRCGCVRANKEKPTDALVMAMDLFRPPPTIATSRLNTYKHDALRNYPQDLSVLIRYARQSPINLAPRCSFAHKCCEMNEHNFQTGANLQTVFRKWPLTRAHASILHTQAYVYETEGYCTVREPVSPMDGSYHGFFLYIFNVEHTGGRITAKVNGVEVSIEKPGECMALLPGCSYTVETVTSGHLVLFEYRCRLRCNARDADNDRGKEGENNGKEREETDDEDAGSVSSVRAVVGSDAKKNTLVWQVRDSYSTEITPERSAALTQAINTALDSYAGVMICLSTYYPAGHSTNTARRCETEPALLRKFDADLYEHLGTFYEVTVVTVAVSTSATSGRSSARVLDFPGNAEMLLKVVAPMQSGSLDRVSSKRMLLTGLLCFARG